MSFLYTNNIEIQTNFYGRLNPPSVANQSPDRYILDTLNLFADDQEVGHVVDSQAAQCRVGVVMGNESLVDLNMYFVSTLTPLSHFSMECRKKQS